VPSANSLCSLDEDGSGADRLSLRFKAAAGMLVAVGFMRSAAANPNANPMVPKRNQHLRCYKADIIPELGIGGAVRVTCLGNLGPAET